MRTEYKRAAFDWPDLSFTCSADLLPPIVEIKLPKKVDPYLNMYYAYCSYYNIQPSSLVIYYVENLEYTNDREFNLSNIPGIENTSGLKDPLQLQIEPIVLALKYNRYFLSLVLSDVARKEIASLVSEVVKTETTLSKLKLSNTDADNGGLLSLSTALRENKNINIEVLEISEQKCYDNNLMHIMSISWSVYPHRITHLNLSKLNCSGKGLVKLFTSFQMNYALSIGLIHLNLSGNKFDESSDVELEKWIDKVHQFALLEELVLSNVGSPPIKSLYKMKAFNHLATLDLSYNKMEPSDFKLLCTFIKESPSIRELDLSGLIDKANATESIMDAIKNMKRSDNVKINLSGNAILSGDSKWVKILQNSKVSHVNISGIHFKDVVLEDVVASLKFATELETLVINGCKTKPKRNSTLFNLLTYIKLKNISMNDSFTTESIHAFLMQIPDHPSVTLESIDISKNLLGDEVIHALCRILRSDGCLKELYCDGNSFSMSAWYAIYQAIAQNKKLVKIGYPMNDFHEILTSTPNELKKKQFCNLIFQIQTLLQQLDITNEKGRFVTTPQVVNIPAPVTPTPLVTVPGHLRNQQTDIRLDEIELSQSDSCDSVPDIPNISTSSHSHIHVSEMFSSVGTPPMSPREKSHSLHSDSSGNPLSRSGNRMPSIPPPIPNTHKPLQRSVSVRNGNMTNHGVPYERSKSVAGLPKFSAFFSGDFEQYDEDINIDEPVRRANINELVVRLSHESYSDVKFMHTMLMTYRASIEPRELFERLISRYFLTPPSNCSEEEIQKWTEQKLKMIRIRVINVLKRWIEAHYHDFMEYAELAFKLRKFLESEEVQKHHSSLASQLINLLEKNLESKTTELVPESLIIENNSKISVLKDQGVASSVSISEVAETLCVLESDIFGRIQLKEFFNQSWNKGTPEERDQAAPNIRGMIKASNRITTWCATEILRQNSASARAKVITYFIKLGINLRNKNNFNGVMEMYAALSLSAIIRLKKSWENVKQKYKQAYEEFVELANSSQSFGNLRNAVKASSAPLIPYLGLYLTDLVFIEDGNPETFDEDGVTMVNFRKNEMLAEVLLEIQNFQQSGYNYGRNDALYCLLLRYDTKTERELYKWSLEVEPREPKK